MSKALRVIDARYPDDFERLRAVREPVFVTEQGCPIEEEWDALDARSIHALVLNSRNEPVATGRLTPQRTIGRMAVLPNYRGNGVGTMVMEYLIGKARELGYPDLSLSAQTHAIPFYQRFGFVAEGPEYLEANIPHRKMSRPLPIPNSSGLLHFDRLAVARAITIDLLRTARHRIGIVSQALDPEIYDDDAVIELIKRLAMSGRGARIQVLVEDISHAIQSDHRLIGFVQRLSSPFEFRRANRQDDPEFGPAMLLTDCGGWLRRPDPTRFEGEAGFEDRARCRELWLAFARCWERAVPETSIRALKL